MTKPGRSVTVVLFGVYALVLIGLVLFKFPFSYDDTGTGRHVNLIPFAGSFTAQGTLRLGEIVENVLVFVPFGIYLCMLRPGWSFGRKLIPIVATTVAFEAIQYAFAIGRADVTDVIGNALGGILGIAVYAVLARALGARTDRILRIAAIILTAAALVFYAFLFVRSSTR
jgi:glycopeptide antibiotics resistance protein